MCSFKATVWDSSKHPKLKSVSVRLNQPLCRSCCLGHTVTFRWCIIALIFRSQSQRTTSPFPHPIPCRPAQQLRGLTVSFLMKPQILVLALASSPQWQFWVGLGTKVYRYKLMFLIKGDFLWILYCLSLLLPTKISEHKAIMIWRVLNKTFLFINAEKSWQRREWPEKTHNFLGSDFNFENQFILD